MLHQITEMQVGKLRPSKRNARTHSKKQIDQIANSIRRFGWTYPILVDEQGNILCGVGRWLAAQKLGLAKVPIIALTNLGDTEKRALALADNKIAANAGWDRSILAAELGELAVLLPECNLDIEITGFEQAEFDGLMSDFVDSEHDPADTPPLIELLPISRRADFWVAGRHRLYCGDAGDACDVRALMGRELADMIFADPPFNVRIGATVGRGKIKHREFASASGEMSSPEFTKFLNNWMTLAAQYSEDGSIHFVCMDWRHLGEILAAGNEAYSELKNLVVWSKTNAGQGSFYRSQHELKHHGMLRLYNDLKRRHELWMKESHSRFLKGDIKQLAYFRDKSRRAAVEFEVIIAQPGASAAAINDDALLLLGTTEMYLKKTAAASFRVIVSP